MIKTFFQDSHEDVFKDGEAFSILQPDSHNIVKSASAAISRDTINRFRPDKDHVAVHLSAMGAEERYGFNRNCDSFPRAALKEYHPTFVSHGNLFREHRNDDPAKRIGLVKFATYNEPMDRVELIVWMDKKAAANECEKARAGKELSFSMSARMPHDHCSICGNQARHQKHYCNCLKYSLGEYIRPMKKFAYAINKTRLRFFDISAVNTRADRQAAYLEYMFGDDNMRKAASARIGGAELSERLGMVEDLYVPFDAWSLIEMRKTAAVCNPVAQPVRPLSAQEVKELRDYDLCHVLGELTKRSCLLDIASFTALITDSSPDELVKNAGFMITIHRSFGDDMLNDMIDNGGCNCGEPAVEMVTPNIEGSAASPCGDSIDRLIAKVEKNLGMSKDAQAHRMLTETPKLSPRADGLWTPETPIFQGISEAYQVYLTKAAAYISGGEQVSHADFHGVLRATNRMLLGKNMDMPVQKG